MIELYITPPEAIALDNFLERMRAGGVTLPEEVAHVHDLLKGELDNFSEASIRFSKTSNLVPIISYKTQVEGFTAYACTDDKPTWLDRLFYHLPHKRVLVQDEYWHQLPSNWIADRWFKTQQQQSFED